jgi:hypothetical protein
MPARARTEETPQDTIVSTIPHSPHTFPITNQIAPVSRAALLARAQLEPKSRGCPVSETKKYVNNSVSYASSPLSHHEEWRPGHANSAVSRMTGR